MPILLTPKGIREKSLLTHSFIERKREDFEVLKRKLKRLKKRRVLPLRRHQHQGEQAVTELTCFQSLRHPR